MNQLKNPKQQEEKLTFTPPSAKEEDDFHKKLHKEMDQAKEEKLIKKELDEIMDSDRSPLA